MDSAKCTGEVINLTKTGHCPSQAVFRVADYVGDDEDDTATDIADCIPEQIYRINIDGVLFTQEEAMMYISDIINRCRSLLKPKQLAVLLQIQTSYRERLHLHLSEIAEIFGTSNQMISAYLRDIRKIVKQANLQNL
jgi:hypothetical protein